MASPFDISDMASPVRCAFCSRVYDLGTVTVTQRYADCSVWRTPCCGNTADDRGETGWKSNKDYYPIDPVRDQLRDGRMWLP